MIKAIAFDVDGVLIDSAHEAFVSAVRALEKLGKKLDSSNLEKKYNKLRPLLRDSKDFFAILKIIEERDDIDNVGREDLDKIREEYKTESKKYPDAFFKSRHEMQDQDYEKWFSLLKTYPNMIKSVNSLAKKYKIAIASTRDMKSIVDIIERLGFDVDKDNIFSKDITESKIEHLKLISDKFSVSPKEIFFIDDNIDQLKMTRSLGINVALSKWGYNNEKQLEEAKKLNILIIEKPEDIEKEIKMLDK